VAALAATACLALAAPAAAGASGATEKRPSKVPSVPLDLTVVPGTASGELVVSWSPPAYDGEYLNRHGQAVPYVITDYDLRGVPGKSWATCVDLSLTCTLTGLRPGHTYEVTARVWNAKGKHSPLTAPVEGIPPA
jgi:hypothetical protein